MKKLLPPVLFWILYLFSYSKISDFFSMQSVQQFLLLLAIISTSIFFLVLIKQFLTNSYFNKFTIIPEFKLKDIKFYELSIIIDGNIDMQDILAILTYYSLNRPKDPDKVEKEIMKYVSSHTISTLYRMYFLEHSTEEEQEANILNDFRNQIKASISSIAQKHNLFKFNPASVRKAGIFITLISIPLLIALQNSSEIFLALSALSLIFIGVHLYIYAPLVYQNHKKVAPILQKALNFKLYLKTVEWYSVEKSEDKMKKFLPFFILYNVKREYFETMIHIVQEELQTDTKNSIFG